MEPEDLSINILKPHNMTLDDENKMTEILKCEFEVKSVAYHSLPAYHLTQVGLDSGLVIDFGTDSIRITPLWEGQEVKYARRRTKMGTLGIIEKF